MTNKEETASEGNERVFYNRSELLGYEAGGKRYSPAEMIDILRHYEALLKQKRFDEANQLEEKEGHPKTWLDGVAWDLIEQKGNGLAKKLNNFRMERYRRRTEAIKSAKAV
jgi:hypothetical protein